MKNKRSRLLVSCLAVGALVLLGGANGFAGGTSENAATGPKVSIYWMEYPNFSVPGMADGEYESHIVADFEKENPNTNVKLEIIPWTGGAEKVNTSIAAGNAPDMLFDYPGRLAGYARQGLLADLKEMLTEKVRSDLPAAVINSCMVNGAFYMYPHYVLPYSMAVNVDIFKRIGQEKLLPLDKPNRSWTIQDFEAALTAVKDSSRDAVPAILYFKDEQADAAIRMFIQNFGTDFISKDATKIVISSQEGKSGLQWLYDSYKKGLFASGPEVTSANDAVERFDQGKSAFCLIFSPWHYNDYKAKVKDGKAPDFDVKFVPFPHPGGSDPRVQCDVGGFSVFNNKDLQKVKACERLIDYIANGEKYKDKTVLYTGNLPVKISQSGLYSDPEVVFTGTLIKYSADTGYGDNNYSKLRAGWYPLMQAVFTGTMAAGDALDKFVRDYEPVLNEK